MDAGAEPTYAPGFLDRVLAWMQTNPERRLHEEVTAASILSIDAQGSDMAGSTEVGFYETFSVYITYTDTTGRKWTRDVQGSEMESLWAAVVASSYP